MIIRKAISKDLENIDKIYLEGVADEIKLQFPNRSKESIIWEMKKAKKSRLKGFRKELRSRNNLWLVAEKEKKIVGFSNAEIKNKREGMLTMNYITKDFRGTGIGKKLTEKRINWLKKMKVKKISAGLFIKNEISIKNLENFGFNPIIIKMEKNLR